MAATDQDLLTITQVENEYVYTPMLKKKMLSAFRLNLPNENPYTKVDTARISNRTS